MERQKVLIVEDDPLVVESVERELEDLGLSCVHCSSGDEGLAQALVADFALVILDLGLPKLGGMEICRRLREKKPLQPILILTGEHDETSTVLALELGADEYLTKPFRPKEFRARVRALLRRVSLYEKAADAVQSSQAQEVQLGPFRVQLERGEASFEGSALILTPTEFDLLLLFLRSPLRVFSREELLDLVWGDSAVGYEQNVRSHLSRLRKKILDAGCRYEILQNMRGFGYRFLDQETLASFE